jgi:hypothetical protein
MTTPPGDNPTSPPNSRPTTSAHSPHSSSEPSRRYKRVPGNASPTTGNASELVDATAHLPAESGMGKQVPLRILSDDFLTKSRIPSHPETSSILPKLPNGTRLDSQIRAPSRPNSLHCSTLR